MKLLLAGSAIAVVMVSGQSLGDEPSCALPCFTSAISAAGCALSDQGCQCGTASAAIQSAVTPCLLSACSHQDLNIAASVGLAICPAYSLTARAPSAIVTNGTPSAESTSISGGPTIGGSKTSTSTSESNASPSNTSTDTTVSSTSSTSPIPTPSKSNTGAIAGGVVGGVAILALIGFLFFYLGRRSTKRNVQNNTPVNNTNPIKSQTAGLAGSEREAADNTVPVIYEKAESPGQQQGQPIATERTEREV